jgi:hypothetical protein
MLDKFAIKVDQSIQGATFLKRKTGNIDVIIKVTRNIQRMATIYKERFTKELKGKAVTSA